MRLRKRHLAILAPLLAALAARTLYVNLRPELTLAFDEASLPKIVRANVVDLAHVGYISKFRGAAGHDYSMGGETCRSMKHYFTPARDPRSPIQNPMDLVGKRPDPATAVDVFSPVDGTVTEVQAEDTPIGDQIRLQDAEHPAFTFRIFHVYPDPGIEAGRAVRAGQRLGIIHPEQQIDVAVRYVNLAGPRFVSFFEVMPDSIFDLYRARGVTSIADLVITKTQRDARPLECRGEQFAEGPGRPEDAENWVQLN